MQIGIEKRFANLKSISHCPKGCMFRYQDLDKVYDIIVKHVNKYKPVSDDKPYSAAFRW